MSTDVGKLELELESSRFVDGMKQAADATQKLTDATDKNVEAQKRSNTEQANTSAKLPFLTRAQKEQAEAAAEQEKEAQKFVDALKKTQDTLGYNRVQLLAYKASITEFTDAQALSVAESLKAIDAHDRLAESAKKAGDAHGASAGAIGFAVAAWESIATLAGKAAHAIVEYAKESALLAARHEQLGVVMGIVGTNIGLNREQLEKYAVGIQRLDIGMNASREIILKMVEANVNLAESERIASVARDAAVIGNVETERAMENILRAIETGQSRTLKTMGIIVDFTAADERRAKQLGITTQQLTDQEKQEARLQEVMEHTTNIMGAYDASLTTAAGKMRELNKIKEDLKTIRGEVFNELLIAAVEAYTHNLEDATEASRKLARDGELKHWSEATIDYIAAVADAFVWLWRQVKSGAMETAATMMDMASKVSLNAGSFGLFGVGQALGVVNNPMQGQIDQLRKDARSLSGPYSAMTDRVGLNRAARNPAMYAADYDEQDFGSNLGAEHKRQQQAEDTARARARGKTKGGGTEDNTLIRWFEDAQSELQKLTDGPLSEFDKFMERVIKSGKQFTDTQLLEAAAIWGTVDALKKENKEAEEKAKLEDLRIKDEARKEAIFTNYFMQVQKQNDQIKQETELLYLNKEGRERVLAAKKLEADFNAAYAKTTEADLDLQKQLTAEYQKQQDALPKLLADKTQAEAQASALKNYVDHQKSAAEETKQVWHTAAKDMQRGMSAFFFDVLSGQTSSLGKTFTNMIRKMLADALAARTMLAAVGDFSKTGVPGGALGLIMSKLGFGGTSGSLLDLGVTVGPSSGSFGQGGMGTAVEGAIWGVEHGGRGPGDAAAAYRFISDSVLATAPRFHSGIGANERAAVLRNDESVLTPGQMRQLSPAGAQSIKVEVVNSGTPKDVQSATPRIDIEGMVVKIIMADQSKNGPVTQGIANTFNLRRG